MSPYNITKQNEIYHISTESEIYILLLHSEKEYYNFICLEKGDAFCACESVKIFTNQNDVLKYIMENELTKYVYYDNDRI